MIKKYNVDMIGYMNAFQKITSILPKDCFEINNSIVFVTNPAMAARAIGKGGKNIKILKDSINRNVKVMEYSNDPFTIARNFMFPLKPKKVDFDAESENKILNIEFNTSRERRVLLNNNQSGLKHLKEILNRYHKDIIDVRIL